MHDKEGHGDDDPNCQQSQADALQNVHESFGIHKFLPFYGDIAYSDIAPLPFSSNAGSCCQFCAL
jgi:hypothetical protein